MSHTGRTYVVTGADGEIGGLTARTLEDRGVICQLARGR